jgi:hypothetical protein
VDLREAPDLSFVFFVAFVLFVLKADLPHRHASRA